VGFSTPQEQLGVGGKTKKLSFRARPGTGGSGLARRKAHPEFRVVPEQDKLRNQLREIIPQKNKRGGGSTRAKRETSGVLCKTIWKDVNKKKEDTMKRKRHQSIPKGGKFTS